MRHTGKTWSRCPACWLDVATTIAVLGGIVVVVLVEVVAVVALINALRA